MTHQISSMRRKAAGVALCLLGISGGNFLSAQTLTVQEGLQLWLKADAGVTASDDLVEEWLDQSGNDHHALLVAPEAAPQLVPAALNNQPVLRFDGVDDYLEIADSDGLSIEGDFTTFFVTRFDDFATYRAVWAKTLDNYPSSIDYYTLPNTGVPRLLRGDGSNANLGTVDGLIPLRANTYLIAGFDMSDTTATHYLAAQPNGSGEITAFLFDNDTPLIIGSRHDLFTKLKGDLAELLIYDRALSAAERAAVVDYLGAKYAIQNLPPTVSLAADPAGPTATQGQTVTLTATAADPDGTLVRVEFLAHGAVFATATAPPYVARVRLDTAGAYSFTVRVIDDDDAVAESAPVTFTVTTATAPELDVRDHLSLWLKADAGITTGDAESVQSWNDQSGQENHALPWDEFSAPTLVTDGGQGQPVVRFDGVDDLLEIPYADSLLLDEAFTTFFVVKLEDFATFRAVWAKTTSNLPAPVDFYALPNTGVGRFYTGDGAAGSFLDGLRPLRAGVFELVGFSRAGNALTQYLNGQPNGRGTATVAAVDQGGTVKIGTRDDNFTQLLGDLAELLIYQSALTEEDAASVQLYLAARHGIPLLTAINEPPTAALTAPVAGASFVAPAEVTLTATAADADGGIAHVEFLVNGTVVAADTTAPYEATVTLTVAGPQELLVRAVDNFGLAAISAPVTITLTSEAVSPLPALPQLSLWLRADEGVIEAEGAVSAWDDQSGKLNHAAQSLVAKRPLLVAEELNGRPVLRFDGVDDDLVVPSSTSLAHTGDLSSFFVVRFDDFATFRAVWGKTSANLPSPTDYYIVPDSGTPRLFRGSASAYQHADASISLFPGEFFILGFDHGAGLARHFHNGELNSETPLTVDLGDTGNPLIIGSRSDGATRLFGDLAEVVIYNKVLEDAERAQVLDYFSAKYDLPVTHSTTARPVLEFAVTGSTITLTWAEEFVDWTLESSSDLETESWAPVPDVIGSSVIEPITGAKFYRLAR